MQIDQPIWFMFNGTKVYGVTQEILPNKAGVMAKIIVNNSIQLIKVVEPHKVRDPQEADAVMKAFGYEPIHAGTDKSEGKKTYTEPVKYNENAKYIPFEDLTSNEFDKQFLSILQDGAAMQPKPTPKPAE